MFLLGACAANRRSSEEVLPTERVLIRAPRNDPGGTTWKRQVDVLCDSFSRFAGTVYFRQSISLLSNVAECIIHLVWSSTDANIYPSCSFSKCANRYPGLAAAAIQSWIFRRDS